MSSISSDSGLSDFDIEEILLDHSSKPASATASRGNVSEDNQSEALRPASTATPQPQKVSESFESYEDDFHAASMEESKSAYDDDFHSDGEPLATENINKTDNSLMWSSSYGDHLSKPEDGGDEPIFDFTARTSRPGGGRAKAGRRAGPAASQSMQSTLFGSDTLSASMPGVTQSSGNSISQEDVGASRATLDSNEGRGSIDIGRLDNLSRRGSDRGRRLSDSRNTLDQSSSLERGLEQTLLSAEPSVYEASFESESEDLLSESSFGLGNVTAPTVRSTTTPNREEAVRSSAPVRPSFAVSRTPAREEYGRSASLVNITAVGSDVPFDISVDEVADDHRQDTSMYLGDSMVDMNESTMATDAVTAGYCREMIIRLERKKKKLSKTPTESAHRAVPASALHARPEREVRSSTRAYVLRKLDHLRKSNASESKQRKGKDSAEAALGNLERVHPLKAKHTNEFFLSPEYFTAEIVKESAFTKLRTDNLSAAIENIRVDEPNVTENDIERFRGAWISDRINRVKGHAAKHDLKMRRAVGDDLHLYDSILAIEKINKDMPVPDRMKSDARDSEYTIESFAGDSVQQEKMRSARNTILASQTLRDEFARILPECHEDLKYNSEDDEVDDYVRMATVKLQLQASRMLRKDAAEVLGYEYVRTSLERKDDEDRLQDEEMRRVDAKLEEIERMRLGGWRSDVSERVAHMTAFSFSMPLRETKSGDFQSLRQSEPSLIRRISHEQRGMLSGLIEPQERQRLIRRTSDAIPKELAKQFGEVTEGDSSSSPHHNDLDVSVPLQQKVRSILQESVRLREMVDALMPQISGEGDVNTA